MKRDSNRVMPRRLTKTSSTRDYWADPCGGSDASRGARRDLGGNRGVFEGEVVDAAGGVGFGRRDKLGAIYI
jgi:hypothetical protein